MSWGWNSPRFFLEEFEIEVIRGKEAEDGRSGRLGAGGRLTQTWMTRAEGRGGIEGLVSVAAAAAQQTTQNFML